MKSPNMISTIGLLPDIAKPIPAPTIAASLIGVEKTRSGNFDDIPLVILNAPP